MTFESPINAVYLRPFLPADQDAIRALILAGLGSRFGTVDESLNPDVDDLQGYYVRVGETVLVAEYEGKLVGSGVLHRENGSDTVGRIVRVSVAAFMQGQGLGKRISQALLEAARVRQFQQVLVETNADWTSALRLYQGLGFRETHRVAVPEYGYTEVHMALHLAD
ncbi:MAG TPA: GNAT family N-acetyltransferase [Aggregatilineales bacterium]|nr:GNAT family N-acetyltransferase [Aggregatilineales bacterium]